MTGFAAVTREDERATLAVTIRSLNHRYLDLQLRVPQSLTAIEGDVRGLVGKRVSRGSGLHWHRLDDRGRGLVFTHRPRRLW